MLLQKSCKRYLVPCVCKFEVMFRFPRRPALAQKQLDAMEHTAPLPASYMRGGRLQYNYRASLFKSMLQGVVQLRYVL